MEEPKRYSCGNGEGMFDDKKGYWISYKEHQEIVNKLKKAITVTPCCKSDSEQLLCKHCDNKKALHSQATGLCPDRFKHFEAK